MNSRRMTVVVGGTPLLDVPLSMTMPPAEAVAGSWRRTVIASPSRGWGAGPPDGGSGQSERRTPDPEIAGVAGFRRSAAWPRPHPPQYRSS